MRRGPREAVSASSGQGAFESLHLGESIDLILFHLIRSLLPLLGPARGVFEVTRRVIVGGRIMDGSRLAEVGRHRRTKNGYDDQLLDGKGRASFALRRQDADAFPRRREVR